MAFNIYKTDTYAFNRSGAQVYEIKAAERTEGTLGFWWCGRFAMHRWAMPIEPLALDLTAYDHVTICTPIWVFSLASPVREFCKQAAGKIKAVDYVLVHHTRGQYESVAAEMDGLLGIPHTSSISVQCRMGEFEIRKQRSIQDGTCIKKRGAGQC